MPNEKNFNEREEKERNDTSYADIYNLDIVDKNFIPAIASKDLMIYLY